MTDRPKPNSTDRRLAEIVREVKIASADRTDVVVDMRDADRARLELLAEEIRPVVADIDPADDRFDFGISPGLQPRLWIDAVAHVHMGHDRRVFRFVRDTRLGRVVISDTSDLQKTANAVARYIAERVIERERIMAGDFEAWKQQPGGSSMVGASPDENPGPDAMGVTSQPAEPAVTQQVQSLAGIAEEPKPRPQRGAGFVLGASWFILGCVAGSAALVVAFWDRIAALIN